MTAPDSRLDEIQARVDHGDTSPWSEANALQDRRYLLAELRKAREALGRVEEVAARLHWEADNANEGAKYAAEVNQGASLMALESERFAYQKAEHLIRAAVATAKEPVMSRSVRQPDYRQPVPTPAKEPQCVKPKKHS